ncbi:MAG TPA: phosphorylase [Sphingobium sp.]|uniref:phosphorylase family protein n=1 Tax=Sphingobium sp. TaxID=1912891 RepID=UPI002ED46F0A
MTLIVACGLKREARIIARPGRDVFTVAGGGMSARLESGLDDAAEMFPSIILSSGIAGALHPALKTGDIVIDGDEDVLEMLRPLFPEAMTGTIVGQDSICASVTAKRELRARTGAIAVDMETHVARRVAARRNLPFAALRIISDTSETTLPPATLVGMGPDGGMAIGPVLLSLARHPGQLPALIRAGRDAGQAFRALGRTHDTLARAGIGLADLRQLPLDMG